MQGKSSQIFGSPAIAGTASPSRHGRPGQPGLDLLSHLGMQLEGMLGPTDILPAICRVVCESLNAPFAAVAIQRLDLNAQDVGAMVIAIADVAEVSSPPPDTLIKIPISHLGQRVGWLLVNPRDESRRLDDDEIAALHGLAAQAGAAVHIVQLMDDLRRTRERLVLAREEERQRLHRNLHDGIGPTLTALLYRSGA